MCLCQASPDEEDDLLIYNYKPIYTGKVGNWAELSYERVFIRPSFVCKRCLCSPVLIATSLKLVMGIASSGF